MIKKIFILFLVLVQGHAFGQCTGLLDSYYLTFENGWKDNRAIFGEQKVGIHYAKFCFDHRVDQIHMIKTFTLSDTFEVSLDTARFADLTSHHFGAIDNDNSFNEMIEVLSITTKETTFRFTTINGCQLIDLLPEFIHEYFIGSDKLNLISELTKVLK
jgi:hypothetical protein